jgi:succinyl-CoA synthetase alpha subunit
MSIVVDEKIRLIIQGITGKQGQYHAQKILNYGTRVLAGVSPGKGGESVSGCPVYNTVAEAKKHFPEINASMIITPPKTVLGSAEEAIAAGIKLIVIITEFVPVHDAMKIMRQAKDAGCMVVGGNTIGVISPGKGKIGVMPDYIYKPGKIGIVSRSGTLTHETASNLTFAGFGQSTCIGIGGDMVGGIDQTQVLELFAEDTDTEVVIIIGEIGGSGEEEAASYIRKSDYAKPVVSYIAGVNAPEGIKMGHAGAIISGNSGTAQSKIRTLQDVGVHVAMTIGGVVDIIKLLDGKLGGKLSTVEPMYDKH